MTCLGGFVVVVRVGGMVGTIEDSNWQLAPTAMANRKVNFNIFRSGCRDETL
jgi:hypothetical protein